MNLRIHSKETKKEIKSSLKYIFPIESFEDLTKEEISQISVSKKKKYLFFEEDLSFIILLLYSHLDKNTPEIGFKIKLVQNPSSVDIDFGNTFFRVFNDDINILPEEHKYSELWISFRESQFRRAIAKFSAFSTVPMLKWIQTVESSTSLKYEGQPFSYCLFMTKQKKWIQKPLEKEFLEFLNPIPFEKALLSEKWIRAIDGKKISLTGLGHKGDIIGMFCIPEIDKNECTVSLSPHEDIESIIRTLIPGTCVFLTTKQGDIYFMLPNNVTFLKTQGKWYYLNYSNILKSISELLDKKIASSILRLVLNLSFDRHGAMISIPDKEEDIEKMVPDFSKINKANKDLRYSIKGLKINNHIQRSLIGSAAKIDGALIISKKGEIVDAACMISEPKEEQLKKVKITKLERFPGARTTATWNASIYGTAIKISEDGPITIYRHGKLISKIG